MKTISTTIICLFCLNSFVYSQTEEYKGILDPRNYAQILEYKRNTNLERDVTPWNKYKDVDDDKKANRGLTAVDIDSEIKIRFNRIALLNEPNFRGNISIIAKINERNIEVAPYSLVGESRDKVGINSAPVKELSNKILGFIGEITDLNTNLDELYKRVRDSTNNKSAFKQYLKTVIDINLSLQYIEFFENKGPETKDIFLNVIATDDEKLQATKTALIEIQQIGFENPGIDPNNFVSFYNQYLDTKTFQLTAFLGRILKNWQNYPAIEKVKNSKENVYNNQQRRNNTTAEDSAKIANDFVEATNKKISEMTFEKLILGSIDLKEADAKEGDILRVYILWYDSRRGADFTVAEDQKKPLQLPLATFFVKEIGFRLKVIDSFLLVNRLRGSDAADANPDNLSPSRYKGAPGASLLLNYGNRRVGWGLDPSVGINLSYLDFDTTKDIEVGVGGIVGFLHNRVFLNVGYNLNVSNFPWYFSLGFSFGKLVETLTSANKTKSE